MSARPQTDFFLSTSSYLTCIWLNSFPCNFLRKNFACRSQKMKPFEIRCTNKFQHQIKALWNANRLEGNTDTTRGTRPLVTLKLPVSNFLAIYCYSIMNCKVTFSALGVLLENNNLGYSLVLGVSRDVFRSIGDGKKYVMDDKRRFLDNNKTLIIMFSCKVKFFPLATW